MVLKTKNMSIKNQGSKWISHHRRLAIYLRDGLACCYCGDSIIDKVQLSLDHIHPHSEGGSNHETNLVTCCVKCNSSRGTKHYHIFAHDVAGYLNNGITGEQIIAHVDDCIRRSLDIAQAKELIARQGSCFKVLKTL
jgi:hypothetical protein